MNIDFYLPLEIVRHKNRLVPRLYSELGLLATQAKEETFQIPGCREMSTLLECDEKTYLIALEQLSQTGFLTLYKYKGRGFACRIKLLRPEIATTISTFEGVNVSTKANSVTLHNLYSNTKKIDDIEFYTREGERKILRGKVIQGAKNRGASEETIRKAVETVLNYDVKKSKKGYVTFEPDALFCSMISGTKRGTPIESPAKHAPQKPTQQTKPIQVPVHIKPTVGFNAERIDWACSLLNEGKEVSGDYISPLFFSQNFPDDILENVGDDDTRIYILSKYISLEKLGAGQWHIHFDSPETIKAQRAGSLTPNKMNSFLAKMNGGHLPESFAQALSNSQSRQE